jgi:uncharacterized protein (DUF342 family)
VLQAGRGVSVVRQQDGSLHYHAETDGELVRHGSLIAVQQVHTVDGDVDMGSGNVNFPGIVRVRGSVRAGFRVLAAGDIEVEETVDAAVLASESAILIGQGIKGDGKAILRAKTTIVAPFAEQAVLLATENVHLKGACLRCRVTCNGKLLLDSEKGNLVGGVVRTRQGIVVQNLGSPAGIRTLVFFGQDFMVKDQIDREEREAAKFGERVTEIDAELKSLQRAAPSGTAAITHLQTEKAQLLNAIERRKQGLARLQEAFLLHSPSEIVVRGTLFPGVVIESHGKRWETRTEKRMITLAFDMVQGMIFEKL